MSTPQPPHDGAQPPQPPLYGSVPPNQPYGPAQPGRHGPAWPTPHGGVPGGPPPFGGPPFGVPSSPRPRPRRAGLIALIAVGAVLVVGGVIAAGAWLVAHDTVAAAAEPGDCVQHVPSDDSDVDEVSVVDCDAPAAGYKVLAKIDGVSGGAEANRRCKAEAPETDSYYVQYRHRNDDDDFALCLQKLV